MEFKLVVVAGEMQQSEFPLQFPTTIGRSRDADITIGHRLVSRRHCEIRLGDDGLLLVTDLGSLNGTFVDNQRIEEPTRLEPGDVLTIGMVTFQAAYGDFKPGNQTGQQSTTMADYLPAQPPSSDLDNISPSEPPELFDPPTENLPRKSSADEPDGD